MKHATNFDSVFHIFQNCDKPIPINEHQTLIWPIRTYTAFHNKSLII